MHISTTRLRPSPFRRQHLGERVGHLQARRLRCVASAGRLADAATGGLAQGHPRYGPLHGTGGHPPDGPRSACRHLEPRCYRHRDGQWQPAMCVQRVPLCVTMACAAGLKLTNRCFASAPAVVSGSEFSTNLAMMFHVGTTEKVPTFPTNLSAVAHVSAAFAAAAARYRRCRLQLLPAATTFT